MLRLHTEEFFSKNDTANCINKLYTITEFNSDTVKTYHKSELFERYIETSLKKNRVNNQKKKALKKLK